jgi:hypothetical protein
MDYPVLSEKKGEFVAQFKATIAVQPKSTAILCGGRALAEGCSSDKKIDDAELAAFIAAPMWKKEEVKKEKK